MDVVGLLGFLCTGEVTWLVGGIKCQASWSLRQYWFPFQWWLTLEDKMMEILKYL